MPEWEGAIRQPKLTASPCRCLCTMMPPHMHQIPHAGEDRKCILVHRSRFSFSEAGRQVTTCDELVAKQMAQNFVAQSCSLVREIA